MTINSKLSNLTSFFTELKATDSIKVGDAEILVIEKKGAIAKVQVKAPKNVMIQVRRGGEVMAK